MPKYAAFLRAINVAGRRITGDELCSHFPALGFHDVAAFRASGNVVFAAESEPLATLTTRIEQGLATALGYEVVAFLRTAKEVRAIAEQEVFKPAHVQASAGKLQVALLLSRPKPRVQEDVLALATDDDRLAFGARELYWLPSGGVLESSLDQKAIAKLLGPMTFRTKGTIEQIAKKYFVR